MLSPSDFNNAVPQFTNGNYASNPLNPQYIAEPTSVEYNRGAEPLQTLPAQWWNWFLNRFTLRFNKLNIYVKNIFNELSQLLSLVSETPSGTEAEPTVGQLKDMFETKYPDYLKTTPALSNTYVPQTTMVNGHALSENVTVTCVACADKGKNGSSYSAFGSNAFNSTAFTTCTGTVTISDTNANAIIPVALCTGATSIGKSTCYGLSYCPSTGALFVNGYLSTYCIKGYDNFMLCNTSTSGGPITTAIQSITTGTNSVFSLYSCSNGVGTLSMSALGSTVGTVALAACVSSSKRAQVTLNGGSAGSNIVLCVDGKKSACIDSTGRLHLKSGMDICYNL